MGIRGLYRLVYSPRMKLICSSSMNPTMTECKDRPNRIMPPMICPYRQQGTTTGKLLKPMPTEAKPQNTKTAAGERLIHLSVTFLLQSTMLIHKQP